MPFSSPTVTREPWSLSVESLPLPTLGLDENLQITHWSAPAAGLFGLDESWRERSILGLIPQGTQALWNHALSTLRERTSWHGELHFQSAHGEALRLEVWMSRQAGRVILTCMNLTARVAQERFSRRAWQQRVAERLSLAAATESRARGSSEETRQLEYLALATDTLKGDAVDPIGTLLLVGGGAMTRGCLELLLEARGYQVRNAADGFEAVEQYDSESRGILAALVDADIPGWGAAAAISALHLRDPLLPIVLLGSREGKRIPEESVHAVLSKPYRLDDVMWGLSECTRVTA